MTSSEGSGLTTDWSPIWSVLPYDSIQYI